MYLRADAVTIWFTFNSSVMDLPSERRAMIPINRSSWNKSVILEV